MGRLRAESGVRGVLLPARLLVGRSVAAALVLDGRQVSGEHATVLWDGQRWRVRDLASRNGTFVDGTRVPLHEEAPLARGARLGFGAADGDAWVLEDDAPPAAFATALDGGVQVAAEGGMLALPAEEPEVCVFRDPAGAWVAEREGQEPARDGQVVVVAGAAWRLSLPVAGDPTALCAPGPSIALATLRFLVSRDGEHVSVHVLQDGATLELEPREHWWPLAVLAEERVKDAGLAEHDQGWLDLARIQKRTGMDEQKLNVYIHRARGHLARAGVDGAAQVVEVRRGQRRLGLPPGRIELASG